MAIEEEELLHLCPEGHLYHVAHGDSWPCIQKFGLLSTSTLLNEFGVRGERRHEIESNQRMESVRLKHPADSSLYAVIRDQIPLNEAKLARCLTGCTLAEFYRLLNRRVFFWLDWSRVETLIGAYPNEELVVLILNAGTFVEAYADRIGLSPINSGSVLYNPAKRGLDLFKSLENFPYEMRKKYGRRAVAELTIENGVRDLAEFLVEAKWIEGPPPGG